MAGYHNYSMSNNARSAYSGGKMPLSKWNKSAILDAAREYLEDAQDPLAAEKMALLKKCTLKALKNGLLVTREWHHTSAKYNCTDFYEVNEWILDHLEPEDVAAWQESPSSSVTPTRKKGNIDWLEWSGTRKHPKATEKRLENVEIEEKGSFYIVYQNGQQVLKKKIGSNGTYVQYL